jgi:hypothetical protein
MTLKVLVLVFSVACSVLCNFMFVLIPLFPLSEVFNTSFFSFQNLSRKNELSALAPSLTLNSMHTESDKIFISPEI